MSTPSVDDEVRVLYVTGGRRIGGMESHLLILASNLPPSIRCVVCCLDASVDYLARLTDLGIEHTNLDCPNLLRPRVLRAYRRLTRVVRRFDPHIVHSYGFSADVIAALLRLGGAKARIITSRRGEERYVRRQVILRLINRLSDRIVCVSPETAAFVNATESPPPRLLEVIPNGVELHLAEDRPRARNPESIRFGTLGTVKPIKGTDLLVDAFMRFEPERRVELVDRRPDRQAVGRGAARARSSGRAHPVHRTLVRAPRLPRRTGRLRAALAVRRNVQRAARSHGVGSALHRDRRGVKSLRALSRAGLARRRHRGGDRGLVVPRHVRDGRESGRPIAVRRAGASIVRRRHSVPSMISQYERLYRSVLGLPCATPVAGEPMSRGMTVDA